MNQQYGYQQPGQYGYPQQPQQPQQGYAPQQTYMQQPPYQQYAPAPQQQPQGSGGYTGQKPQFIEFITPVGIVEYCYIDQPQVDTDQQGRPKLDNDGIPLAYKKVTLSWPKQEYETTLIPFRTLAAQARDQKWAPGSYDPAMFYLEPFLRDGDNPQHNTKAKPELRGRVYMTFKLKCKPKRNPNVQGGIEYTGAPGIMGPYEEDLTISDIYSGCKARVSGVMFGTEYSGRKFISVRLNNIQKHSDGERRAGSGGPPDPRTQFAKAPPMQGVPPPGIGGPASVGMAVLGAPGGFMPSPQQQAYNQQQQAPFGQFNGGFPSQQQGFGGQQPYPPRTIL